MAVENRLTAEQLEALAPGDPVTIECGGDVRRPRRAVGTVVRSTSTHIVVSVRSANGVSYQEQYRLRDGIREGGGLVRAELVDAPIPIDEGTRRRVHHIDALYRDWSRNRSDLERLRRLQTAIAECLEAEAVSS